MKKLTAFKQFSPEEIYNGIVYKGTDNAAPRKVIHYEGSNRPTGIEVLDKFCDLLRSEGHRYPHWFARQLGINNAQLYYTTETLTGYSSSDFIDAYLILLITDLLAATDEQIATVARRVGFPRASELGQFVRRMRQCTPSELRHMGRARQKNHAPDNESNIPQSS